MKPGKLQTK